MVARGIAHAISDRAIRMHNEDHRTNCEPQSSHSPHLDISPYDSHTGYDGVTFLYYPHKDQRSRNRNRRRIKLS